MVVGGAEYPRLCGLFEGGGSPRGPLSCGLSTKKLALVAHASLLPARTPFDLFIFRKRTGLAFAARYRSH